MYLLGHQGWTDFFSQFAIYRSFGRGTVLVVDPAQIPFVKRLFMGTELNVEQLEWTEQGPGVCVLCHQIGDPVRCPRAGGNCRYPKKEKYPVLQGLCVFDDPIRWGQVYRDTLSRKQSFVEAFYIYHNLPTRTLYEMFDIVRIPDAELPRPTSSEYLVYHMQPQVGIPLHRLSKELVHVSLDKRCDDFFGCLRILEEAKEIHVVQSSYCMFVYLLQLKYGMFANKPVFVYASSRVSANTDYVNMNRHPVLPNWTFL